MLAEHAYTSPTVAPVPAVITDPLSEQLAADPGDDFEVMCIGLLSRRYGAEQFQRIPAAMGGDCGIEAFSTDGLVYQCYADRDSASLRARTDKQKNKLTRDTNKLRDRADPLQKMLGDLTIAAYIFLVPDFHAAELVAHAASRSEVVRQFELEFVSSTFEIRVKTPQDYPAELNAALKDGAAMATVSDPRVDAQHIELFSGEKPELIAVLEEKLAVLEKAHPGTDVVVLRDQLIRAFLAKEQVMDGLRAWPSTWEAVEKRRTLRQERLALESTLSSEAPNNRVLNEIDSYAKDLLQHVSSVHDEDAQRLALGQTAEWLMRCPLQFRSTP